MADDKKTIIVFSGDLDRGIAAIVITAGAVAMGNEVTMFFTFWGLNLLRKPGAVPVKKSPLEAMFGWSNAAWRGKGRSVEDVAMGGLGTAMMQLHL